MKINAMRIRIVAALLCVVVVAMVGMSCLSAQESETPRVAPENVSLFETLKKGGTIGWLIVFLSVVAVALAVEHAIAIRRSKLMPMSTILQIRALIKKRNFDELRDFCETDRSFVAAVIGAGVAEPRSSYDEIEDAMMEAGSDQTAKLYRKIEYLSLIGNIAPMLGLLGTVAGMIRSFNTIAQTGGFAKPAELAGGISMALITTYEGLTVAVPVLIAYVYFRNKIEALSTEVAEVGEELMKPIRRRAYRDREEDEEDEE